MTARLPFALTPLPGEPLPDYLAALALHLHTTVEELCEALALAAHQPAVRPDALSRATGLSADQAQQLLAAPARPGAISNSAVAAALRGANRRPRPACTGCHTDPGADPAWILPWTIHCPSHAADTTEGESPETAAARATQQFIDTAVRALNGPTRPAAIEALTDLTTIAAHHTTPGTAKYWYTGNLADRLGARILISAHQLLTSPLAGQRGDPLTTLVSRHEPTRPIAVPQSWSRSSPALRQRIARRENLRISPVGALRYATTLPSSVPGLFTGEDPAHQRARHIPDQLWPDWAIRLTDQDGVNNPHFRSSAAVALMLPGSTLKLRQAATLIHPGILPGTVPHHLTRLATAPGGTTALRVLTELALALDQHPLPIDYARRRQLAAGTELLTKEDWNRLAKRAGIRPGSHRRFDHARRYLYDLLTGGSLALAAPPYHLPEGHNRFTYHEFHADLPADLHTALAQHARTLLQHAGITGEPLTWSPPASWTTARPFPGADPDLTDPHTVRAAVRAHRDTDHRVVARHAAAQLGISTEHLRHVLRHHPDPEPRHFPDPPGSIKPLTNPAATEPYTATTHPRHPERASYQINLHWLREQYVTHGRTLLDIANEIGCTKAALRTFAETHGLPLRPRSGGTHYIPTGAIPGHPADLPDLLRAALTGPNGKGRVERLLTIAAHPSLNQAAATLGTTQSALSTQLAALERTCGGPLLQRRPRPHPVGPLTELGEQLCQQARQHLHPPQHTNE